MGDGQRPVALYAFNMDTKEKDTKIDITDVLCDRPIGFNIGTKYYTISPPSLGETLLRSQIFNALEIDKVRPEYLMTTLLLQMKDHRRDAARFLSICTLRGKRALDNQELTKRASIFEKNLNDEEMVSLILSVIASEHTDELIIQLGIDKQQDIQRRIAEIKAQDHDNTISTGGVSIYGSIIGSACEKYGWTYDQCVWGISYANLRLMLADSVNTAILDDKERRMISVPRRGEKVIDAGDARNIEELTKNYLNEK